MPNWVKNSSEKSARDCHQLAIKTMLAVVSLSSTALLVPAVPARARVVMADKFRTPELSREVEECLVDAVGYGEISACTDFTEPVPRAENPVEELFGGVSRFFNRMTAQPGQTFAVDQEECIIDAENADEIAACFA